MTNVTKVFNARRTGYILIYTFIKESHIMFIFAYVRRKVVERNKMGKKARQQVKFVYKIR